MLTFGELVIGQFDLGEVSAAEVAPEAVEADPFAERHLLEPALVVVQSVQQPLIRTELIQGVRHRRLRVRVDLGQ